MNSISTEKLFDKYISVIVSPDEMVELAYQNPAQATQIIDLLLLHAKKSGQLQNNYESENPVPARNVESLMCATRVVQWMNEEQMIPNGDTYIPYKLAYEALTAEKRGAYAKAQKRQEIEGQIATLEGEIKQFEAEKIVPHKEAIKKLQAELAQLPK